MLEFVREAIVRIIFEIFVRSSDISARKKKLINYLYIEIFNVLGTLI